MARYSDIKPSGYAWEVVTVPLANVPHGLQTGTPEQLAQWERDGKPAPVQCGIRALSPEDEILVYQFATAYAKTKGVETFEDTNPICVLSVKHYTLAMACVDLDSPDRCRPSLFFGEVIEEAAETLRKDPKRCITPDTVAYLYERYEVWKDKINPQALSRGDMDLYTFAEKAAADADFLALARPGMLVTYTHILAVELCNLRAMNAGLTTTSASDTKKKPSVPAKKTSKKARRK